MILLIVLYFLAAAAAFSGYYNKWGFRDSEPRFAFSSMIEGTASRPFVYRQLGPVLVNAIDRLVPSRIKNKLTEETLVKPSRLNPALNVMRLRIGIANNPIYAFRYLLLYYLSFAFLFASLFLMRGLCRRAGASPFAATAAPAAFILGLPMLLSIGGYYYDLIEIFFFAAAAYLALGRGRIWLIPLAIIASLNKESFLFFVVTLAPLAIRNIRDWRGACIIGSSAFVSGLVYIGEKLQFSHNSGSVTEFHLFDNLKYYTKLSSFLEIDFNYGILTPAGFSIISLMIVGLLIALGGRRLNSRLNYYAVAVLLVNVPLFVLFAMPGEVRNLSFLYPVLLLLIAGTIDGLNPLTAKPWAQPVLGNSAQQKSAAP